MVSYFLNAERVDPRQLAPNSEVVIIGARDSKILLLVKGRLHGKPLSGSNSCNVRITCVFVGGSIKGKTIIPGEVFEIPNEMINKLSPA